MPTITLDAGGQPKSAIVEGAYEFCGLNSFEYERTPEEMTTGLRRLNSLMALLKSKGLDLGFDFPTYGAGLLEEPSGIPDDAVEPICALLAQRIAPTLGATLSPDAKAVLSTAVNDLFALYAAAPPSMVPASIPRSMGVRRRGFVSIETLDTPTSTDDPGDLAGMLG
jgi:hypothetical protein